MRIATSSRGRSGRLPRRRMGRQVSPQISYRYFSWCEILNIQNGNNNPKRQSILSFAIMEISTHAQFAHLSYKETRKPSDLSTDRIYLSIYSILHHAAIASRILWSNEIKKKTGIYPADCFGITKDNLFANRKFRNVLVHIDERIPRWIAKMKSTDGLADFNVLPKGSIKIHPSIRIVHIRNYDPITEVFTLYEEDLQINTMISELIIVQRLCDNWLIDAKNR